MKIKISKKNKFEQNCGDSALPSMIEPTETVPVAGDVTQMTPQEAYNAGYNDAIEELMEIISGMITGGIPIDTAVPADIAHMDQLEES